MRDGRGGQLVFNELRGLMLLILGRLKGLVFDKPVQLSWTG